VEKSVILILRKGLVENTGERSFILKGERFYWGEGVVSAIGTWLPWKAPSLLIGGKKGTHKWGAGGTPLHFLLRGEISLGINSCKVGQLSILGGFLLNILGGKTFNEGGHGLKQGGHRTNVETYFE